MTVRLPPRHGEDTIGGGMPDGSIRVALVEDKRVIREGLGEILGRSAGIACVGTYASVEQALPGLENAACDVLLLDIHLPGMSGVDGVRAVLDRFPATRVLMLTVFEEEEKVFDSIRNGASGYLLKKTPPSQTVEPVRQAVAGGAPLSPEIARRMVDHFRRSAAPAKPDAGLTEQERELLKLLAEGHSYAAAAERLGISINTVRDHVRSLYEKLHVHSKSQAVSTGIRRGLIT